MPSLIAFLSGGTTLLPGTVNIYPLPGDLIEIGIDLATLAGANPGPVRRRETCVGADRPPTTP